MKNYYLLIGGVICLFTAFLHTIGGQIDLVNPMMESDLEVQASTELLGVWHMVTVTLFVSAYVLLKNGLRPLKTNSSAVELVAWLFILFGIAYLLVSLVNGVLAPQWILLLPIGTFTLFGLKKQQQT